MGQHMVIELAAAILVAGLGTALWYSRKEIRQRDAVIAAYRTQLVVSERYLREIKRTLAADGGIARPIAHARRIAEDLGQFGTAFLNRSPQSAWRLREIDRYLQVVGATVGLPTQAAMPAKDASFERTYAPLARYIDHDIH